MAEKSADTAPREKWTLVRRARQLLTLHGPSGPRRGFAANELTIIPDGAVLIHNGVIEDVGPSRRVENLTAAKNAREIDARGKVVMPSFVDADAVLAFPAVARRDDGRGEETPLRVTSLRRLELRASAAAADWTRYGALTVGAHSGYAFDLRNIVKVLRAHQACQSRPLRIRSIFSPRAGGTRAGIPLGELIQKWLPAIRKRKLAAIVEFTIDNAEGSLGMDQIREAAIAAAGLGYSIRIRASGPLQDAARDLALAAGAVAVIAAAPEPEKYDARLADAGCIHILSACDAFGEDRGQARAIRHALDQGLALVLASGYRIAGEATFNPQFLLHLACGRLGLSEAEAITATTYNAACSLRMSHVTGSLEPGKSADLLVMDVPDYRDLPRRAGHSDVYQAIRAGHCVYRRAPVVLD